MVNSGSINGVPATASHYLLTDILRGQLGFQGVVISDYQDVPALQTAYHIAPDLAGAIAEAVNAGVDMSMQVFDAGPVAGRDPAGRTNRADLPRRGSTRRSAGSSR